jgi:hypothetical protein
MGRGCLAREITYFADPRTMHPEGRFTGETVTEPTFYSALEGSIDLGGLRVPPWF